MASRGSHQTVAEFEGNVFVGPELAGAEGWFRSQESGKNLMIPDS
jgi:hypothetical protein